jgi:hypothetical protein
MAILAVGGGVIRLLRDPLLVLITSVSPRDEKRGGWKKQHCRVVRVIEAFTGNLQDQLDRISCWPVPTFSQPSGSSGCGWHVGWTAGTCTCRPYPSEAILFLLGCSALLCIYYLLPVVWAVGTCTPASLYYSCSRTLPCWVVR